MYTYREHGTFFRTNDLSFSITMKSKQGAVLDQEWRHVINEMTCADFASDKLAVKRLLRYVGECEHGLGARQYQALSIHFVWCGLALWLCVSYWSKLNTHGDKTRHLGSSKTKGRENSCGKILKIIKHKEWEYMTSSYYFFHFCIYLKIFKQKHFWECPKAKQRFPEREHFSSSPQIPVIVTPIIINCFFGISTLK